MPGRNSGWKRAIRGMFFPLAFLAAMTGSGLAGGGGAINLDSGEAQALIREHAGDRNFVVLDVRTPGEFAQGHLEGAVLVDYRSPEFRQQVARLDRTKIYLVYCRTGNRSSKAMGIFQELGFRNTYHLERGIKRWVEEGLPTVR